jgi:hypothetical protein
MMQKNVTVYTPDGISRRASTRIRAHGVVALTSLEQPIITRIFDIAPGGVSFLHPNDLDILSGEIEMDILLFDSLTNVEYFISQAKGRITSNTCISDPQSDTPVTRFGVEFLKLDLLHLDVLKACLGQIPEDPFTPYETA